MVKKAKPDKRSVAVTQDSSVTTYFEERRGVKSIEKDAVAVYVVNNIIKEGDSILIDAGTSLFPIAQKIADKTKLEKEVGKTHFTIMTHNYEAFQILVDNVESKAKVNIVLAGGRYDQDLNALFGPQTIKAYEDFYPKVVLMGISGLVSDIGLFCHGNTEELPVKEVIFKKSELARDRIIIADYTKLGVPDAMCFGRSDRLRGAGNCQVVTSTPGGQETQSVKTRFDEECKNLKNVYGVTVVKIDS